MSQENVEIAARWYDVATSKAELLTAMTRTMEFCHPEVEWSAPEDGTTYRGRDGVRQRLEEWLESFGEYRYEVQRIIDREVLGLHHRALHALRLAVAGQVEGPVGQEEGDALEGPTLLTPVDAVGNRDVTLAGDEGQAVGLGSVVRTWYVDPKKDNPRLIVIDVTAGEALPLSADIERIPPGKSVEVPFSFTFARREAGETAGDTTDSVQVRAEVISTRPDREDRLLADSTAFYAARVVPGIPTLIVDGGVTYARG